MSNDEYDDPFGLRGGTRPPPPDDSDRTVLIPTPGGRSRRAAPDAHDSAFSSAPAPDNPFMPETGGAPYAAPPLTPEFRPETYAPAGVSLGAGGLGPPAFAAGELNPLLDSAAPLLALLVKLRSTPVHADPAGLRTQVAEQVRTFEGRARERGISPESVFSARYVLCTAIDEVVLSHPWGSESVWATGNLLSTFHNEVAGGETFFRLLDTLGQDSRGNLYLLELMYVLLSLGFEGRYRMQANGRHALEDIRERMYRVLRMQRGDEERELSPRWRGINENTNPLIAYVPLWVVAAVGALALAGTFAFFSFSLHASSDPVAFRLHNTGTDMLPVERREVVPLPPRKPPVDLPTLLADDIAAGRVDVVNRGVHTAVIIQGDNLFRSGSATVQENLNPLIERIADAVDKVPGAVLVTGHTDNLPIRRSIRFPSNFVLSTARAEGVVKLMAARMGDAGRLTAEGRADTEPVAPNDTRANRARNRRVEILVANGV